MKASEISLVLPTKLYYKNFLSEFRVLVLSFDKKTGKLLLYAITPASVQAPLKVPQRILGPGAGPFLCPGAWDYGLF